MPSLNINKNDIWTTIMNYKELLMNFELMDDWEDKYQYLIDLGKQLPVMPEELKIDANIVKGCMSRVWLDIQSNQDALSIRADSDAHIVRGLIAILLILFNNKTKSEILNINIDEVFLEIGLNEHLSPNRRNGFLAMIDRIKNY